MLRHLVWTALPFIIFLAACQQETYRPIETRAKAPPPVEWASLEWVRPVFPEPPPDAKPETPGPQPSLAHVWVSGYWAPGGTDFSWRPGHWAVPPSVYTVWIEPQWVSVEGGYRFRAGTWRWNKP